MNQHFDALEIRDPAEREAAQLAALPRLIAHAQQHSPAATHTLAGIHPANVNSWAALASLPVTRKHALLERQLATRPADSFGGFASVVRGRKMPRIFASPGPIYEPDVARPDYWRLGRALYAAGFREGDLAHNSFSYHMTPGAFMMESGAHAIGCSVFPAGTGQTEQQLAAIADLRPEAYVGTPSFLRILLEKAHASGSDISSIQRALVSGEAFPPSLRDWLESHGIAGYQCYVTADLGLIAYETEARQGLVLDEAVLVEIVRPGTGDPLPAGEVGELVVTTLNPDYPLIRFGTGDLSAVMPGTCPTGRSNTRIKGWLGRADQITKVRGMFVHPGQIAEIVKRFPEVLKARLVVSGEMANDAMTLKLEVSAAPEGLAARIGEAVRDVTKLRSDVDLISPGNLPNDGLVIEDARSYK
jgi:phenylacetate-CoA ligase